MYIRLLQIRDFEDVSRYLTLVSAVERASERFGLLCAHTQYGPNIAQSKIIASSSALAELLGRPLQHEQVTALLEVRPLAPTNSLDAAIPGYADLLRLILDHSDEIPFLESQVKYFHSILLRHDGATASHRRMYRQQALTASWWSDWGLDEAPKAGVAAAEMPRLVQWTQQVLSDGSVPALIAIAVFLYRFLVLRPFVTGNGRLAMALAFFLLDRSGYKHVRYTSIETLISERQADCAEALRQSQHAAGDREDATPWVFLFLNLVAESTRRAMEAIPEPSTLQPKPEPELRLHPRHRQILQAMDEKRSAKIGDLLADLKIPRATLKRDLKDLVNAGYVTSEGIRKGTVYHAVRRPES